MAIPPISRERFTDVVAILDQGRIIRQGPTEALREEVRRMILPRDVVQRRPPPVGLLDVRRQGEQFEIVVDGAPRFVEELTSTGQTVEATGMSLDDIFEAFVIGRPHAWGEAVA